MKRLIALPLLALVLASCGGDDSLTSADAQKDCVNGASDSPAAAALTEEQKVNYCKCLLPKLDELGVKNDDNLEKAVEEDEKVGAAVRDCALKHLVKQ